MYNANTTKKKEHSVKKIIALMLVLAIGASADYELFVSQTRSISPVKKEVVYFGPYDKFSDKLKRGSKNALYGTMIMTAAGGLGMGLATGLIQFLDPYMISWRLDQKYLKVIRMEDGRGNIAYRKILFVGDKNPVYDEKFMNEVMK